MPTEYKSAKNSLKLYERIKLETTPFAVTPKFVKLKAFSLIGYMYSDGYIPHYWNKYHSGKLSKKLSGGKSCADFGVSIWNHKMNKQDYFIGIRSDEALGDISNTIKIKISNGLYAVFTTPESTQFDYVNTVHKTWNYIRSWSPENGYRCANNYQFETRIEDSGIFSEDIYIPLKKIE